MKSIGIYVDFGRMKDGIAAAPSEPRNDGERIKNILLFLDEKKQKSPTVHTRSVVYEKMSGRKKAKTKTRSWINFRMSGFGYRGRDAAPTEEGLDTRD